MSPRLRRWLCGAPVEAAGSVTVTDAPFEPGRLGGWSGATTTHRPRALAGLLICAPARPLASQASWRGHLDADTFPVERGFRYTSEADFRLTVLFQMLVSMAVDRGLYTALTDVDVVEEFAEIWEVLAGLEWVRITPSHVELVGDGVFYTPLIQSLLARDRVLELRRTGFDRSM